MAISPLIQGLLNAFPHAQAPQSLFNQMPHPGPLYSSMPHPGNPVGAVNQAMHPMDVAGLIHALIGAGHPSAFTPNASGEIHGFGPGGPVTIPAPTGITPGPPPANVPPPPGGYDAHNPAQYYHEHGDNAYAASVWESRHPYAVSHHNIPGWVTQALMHAIQGAQPAPAPAPPPPSMQYQ